MGGKEQFEKFKNSELGTLASYGIDYALRSKACKLILSAIIVSSAIDGYKTLNNIDDGKVIPTTSSIIHFGTEFPLALGIIKQRKNALEKEEKINALNPGQEVMLVTKPPISENFFPLVSATNP